jgi:hypothetical protein
LLFIESSCGARRPVVCGTALLIAPNYSKHRIARKVAR